MRKLFASKKLIFKILKKHIYKSIYYLVIFVLLAQFQIVAQGTLINNEVEPIKIDSTIANFDPARYHKLQIIDFKLGRSVSDDRGFQNLLKSYGLAKGVSDFYEIGVNYQFLIKKVNLGGKGNIAYQKIDNKPKLWHGYWQGSIGYAIIRKEKKIITVNANLGVQTSTIRFGSVPPTFLASANVSHYDSKLFQKQFIIGPTINFNQLYFKNSIDRGLSLGFEAGVNFAPIKGTWKYGYRDDDDVFVGDKVSNMPQAARQTFFATLKFGFWGAR